MARPVRDEKNKRCLFPEVRHFVFIINMIQSTFPYVYLKLVRKHSCFPPRKGENKGNKVPIGNKLFYPAN